jgi:hypothetical protein
LLSFFVIDISIGLIAFGLLYFRDIWNTIDIFAIAVTIAFVVLEFFTVSNEVKGLLKVRAIFRMLRIFILIRKLNALRHIKEKEERKYINLKSRDKRTSGITTGYDMLCPCENVVELLTKMRDQLDLSETGLITDLNYCLKMISSN